MKRLILFTALFTCTAFSAGGPGKPEIPWLYSFERAIHEAQQASKPVFVDVYADWCSWCHVLDKEVYTDPRVIEYLKAYVTAKINADDNDSGTELADRYGAEGLPTLLVTDSRGKLLNRIAGFRNANDLLRELEKVQSLLAREARNPNDIQTAYEIAGEYMERRMFEEAEPRLRKALASGTLRHAQSEHAQYQLGLANYFLGNPDAAQKATDQYFADFPGGESEEQVLLLAAQIQLDRQDKQLAAKYLTRLMQKYPQSENAPRVEKILAGLSKTRL